MIVIQKQKKPNFNKMTRQELRSYILIHRGDDDAIEVLINRRNSHRNNFSNLL
ncbi:DUF6887 family protein [Floridanema evergladense]|uniref:Uncharacterized protein n=1 Tax=Floridaenema evergladense BLCC-F167 TaxID=3153639 RepID=A0ABV4WVW1_9CYAN